MITHPYLIPLSLNCCSEIVPHPVLVIMTDGMDQAHWAIPRMRGLRGPKSWGKYFRPRVKVQGVWVFFLGVYFFLADDTQAHDSNMTIEVIARALDQKINISQSIIMISTLLCATNV